MLRSPPGKADWLEGCSSQAHRILVATASIAAWALPALELVNWGSQTASGAACRSCLPLVVGACAVGLCLGCCSGCAWGWLARGAVGSIPPSAVRFAASTFESLARGAAENVEADNVVRRRAARPHGAVPNRALERAHAARPVTLQLA